MIMFVCITSRAPRLCMFHHSFTAYFPLIFVRLSLVLGVYIGVVNLTCVIRRLRLALLRDPAEWVSPSPHLRTERNRVSERFFFRVRTLDKVQEPSEAFCTNVFIQRS
jgi:hypothetical protein